METTLVAPHCAGTSRICGKIKKSNVLHYICHFTSDKNNFLYSWLFFSLTWAENEHWQPLVALRPLEAVKSFISCPCDTGKQPLIPKIVSDTGKMTNEWSKVLLFFKIESWNFQNLFETEFRETSAHSANSDNCYLHFFLLDVWLSWNFVRFHEIHFQTDAESFSFLSWKTKKFYS